MRCVITALEHILVLFAKLLLTLWNLKRTKLQL